jgi:pSer/pThr/pTyr-binding forkhead associated (FHA) protein
LLYLYHVNTFAYHELKADFLIGRTAGNLVFGDDGRMSGKHAIVSYQVINGQTMVYIEDQGSKNLSVVNRIQIPSFQKIRIKALSLLEIGSQQFILTENKTMSLETLNEVMDHHMNRVIVKLEKEKTSTNVNVPQTFQDPIVAKEKKLEGLEKELQLLDQNTRAELAKLDEAREKLINTAKAKMAVLSKEIMTIKSEVNAAKTEKQELENKMKKVINIKNIG